MSSPRDSSPPEPAEDTAGAEYAETRARVIQGRASVQEAQGFIDFPEGAIPNEAQLAFARRVSPAAVENAAKTLYEREHVRYWTPDEKDIHMLDAIETVGVIIRALGMEPCGE